jgi:hypothetical protein
MAANRGCAALLLNAGCFLLDGTGDRGENVIGIGSDEPDRSNDNDQDYRQHDGILRDILSLLVAPKSAYKLHRRAPFSPDFLEIRGDTPAASGTDSWDLSTRLSNHTLQYDEKVVIYCIPG